MSIKQAFQGVVAKNQVVFLRWAQLHYGGHSVPSCPPFVHFITPRCMKNFFLPSEIAKSGGQNKTPKSHHLEKWRGDNWDNSAFKSPFLIPCLWITPLASPQPCFLHLCIPVPPTCSIIRYPNVSGSLPIPIHTRNPFLYWNHLNAAVISYTSLLVLLLFVLLYWFFLLNHCCWLFFSTCPK